MFKSGILLLILFLFFSSYLPLLGDILITKDDMILNGKILEEKPDEYVKFGNYHGTFHVEYSQIKEIYRTQSFEEDIKIFQDKGKSVNESEVETNYQAGLDKLEEQEKLSDEKPNKEKAVKDEEQKEKFSVFFSPFFNYNLGTLSSELPYSYGVSATGHINLDQFSFINRIHLTGITTELTYLHSEKGVKQVFGPRISIGPFWKFPLSIGSFHFNYCLSSGIGIGLYRIKGISADTTAVKWNALLATGPVFNISSVLIYPHIKFDYIYDNNVPLLGTGAGIGAGFSF